MLQSARVTGAVPAFQSTPVNEGRGHLCITLGYQHDVPGGKPRPETSAWPLMVTSVTSIITDPCCYMATDPDMAPSGSVDQKLHYDLRWQHQAVPQNPQVPNSTVPHNAQPILLLFLSHLSTTYLQILTAPCVGKPCGSGQAMWRWARLWYFCRHSQSSFPALESS